MKIVKIGTLEVRSWSDAEPVPDGWAELTVPLVYCADGFELCMVALTDPPYLRAFNSAELKDRAADQKRVEIDREQEIRSQTVVGFVMPQPGFALIEEFYTDILLPAARRNITETDTPIIWGLKQLRDNRNTLLTALEAWVADPAKTADDILAFDIANWAGWAFDRP